MQRPLGPLVKSSHNEWGVTSALGGNKEMGNVYWNKEFEGNVSAVKGSDSDVKSDAIISCRSSSAE